MRGPQERLFVDLFFNGLPAHAFLTHKHSKQAQDSRPDEHRLIIIAICLQKDLLPGQRITLSAFAGSYAEELAAKPEVLKVCQAIESSFEATEARAMQFREQFLRFSNLWLNQPSAALQVQMQKHIFVPHLSRKA